MIAGGHRSVGGFRPRPQANVAQPLSREADPAEHGRWLAVRGSPSMMSESETREKGIRLREVDPRGPGPDQRSDCGHVRRGASGVAFPTADGSGSGQAVRPQEGAGWRESSRSSRGWARRRSSSVRRESLGRFARASTAARPGLARRDERALATLLGRGTTQSKALEKTNVYYT